MTDKFIKHSCGLYIKHSPEWEIQVYGVDVLGKGDIFFNTMQKIMMDKDKSIWAESAFYICYIHLRYRISRWPVELDQFIDSKNKIDHWISKFKYKHGLAKHVKYRPKKSFTRDPYILTIAAAVYFGKEEPVKNLKIPFYLFTPSVYFWHRYLRKHHLHDKVLYVFFEKLFLNKQPLYALNLSKWMAIMADSKILLDKVNALVYSKEYLHTGQ